MGIGYDGHRRGNPENARCGSAELAISIRLIEERVDGAAPARV